MSPYNYNSSNELTSTPSGSYTYDNNGNRKSDPAGAQYSWDFENRLTQVVLPGTGGTVNFKYDPFGRRVQKAFTQNGTTTTTDYLYDGVNILETINLNGTVLARYTDSLNIDAPLSELVSGTTSYYEQDGLGSVSSLSNSAGALANTYTYDSYGKLTASTGTLANPFQYTGREFDSETGIYEYRARYYDQGVGRFVSEDPIGFDGGYDLYTYAGNSPVNDVDPSGLQSDQPCGPLFQWICNIFGPKPAPRNVLCTRVNAQPQTVGKIEVCTYTCDSASGTFKVLLNSLRRYPNCKNAINCPYQVYGTTGSGGSNTDWMVPVPNVQPALEPPPQPPAPKAGPSPTK